MLALRFLRTTGLAMAVCALGSAASAQAWQLSTFDNGAWFEAWVTAAENWPEFHCGGVSPRGLPLPESDEAMLTQPGTLGLIMPDRRPGLGYDDPPPRSDLRLVTDRNAFGLPNATYDLLNADGWTHPIRTKDAAIAALSASQAWAIDGTHGRWGPFPSTGLGPALAEMIAYCETRWATPPAQSQAPAAATDVAAMMQVALARDLAETCNGGGYTVDPGNPLAADLDADGQPDLVMDFRAVSCIGALYQNQEHCGAALCGISVYLSSRYPLTGAPDDFLGIGATLVQGTDGKVWIGTGNRAAACPDAYDPATCTFYWRAGADGLEVVPRPAP